MEFLPRRLFFVFLLTIEVAIARPKIGLVLSGGGARGISHIGVLKEFERRRIPIDVITGTSIGSIVGALYASGYSVEELDTLFQNTNWEEILFNDRVNRKDLPFRRKTDFERYPFNIEVGFNGVDFKLPPGLVYGQKLSALLDRSFLRVADIRDFTKLPIPFSAAATDIEGGRVVVLNKGYLPDAIKASAAYPGLFSPVEIDGHQLLDGGATNNVPVDLAKQLGADIVIAVDVSLFLKTKDSLKSVFQIMEQMITIMLQYTTVHQTEKASYVIKPAVGTADLFEVLDYSSLVQAGQTAAVPILDKLKSASVSEEDYRRYDQKRRSHNFQPKIIDEIRGDANLLEGLRTRAGREFNLERLENDVRRIYARGDYETADYDLSKDGDKTILTLRAKEKSWGPHFLHFAVTWDGELQGKQDGNAIINMRFTQLNRLGAELKTDTSVGTHLEFNSEFYQPLEARRIFFLAPRLIMYRDDEDYYLNDDKVASTEVDVMNGGIDAGLALGPIGEVRAGYRRGFLNSDLEVGVSSGTSFNAQLSGIIARFRIDRLDSAYFPKNGVYGACDFLGSRREWAASDSYRKLGCQLHGFGTVSAFTFFLQGVIGTSLNSILPHYDQFSLGGFRSFSGFRMNELKGQHMLMARAGMLWRVPIPRTLFWDRIFLGGWSETGNTFEDKEEIEPKNLRYSGTAGLGFETKLGAAFLAYGQSGTKHKQFYISVGRTFGIVNFLPYFEGTI